MILYHSVEKYNYGFKIPFHRTFIDVKLVFDSVFKEKLIATTRDQEFLPPINTLYSNTGIKVQHDSHGQVLDPISITQVIKQGSLPGPLFFNLSKTIVS